MRNQNKLQSSLQFFVASVLFFGALLSFITALGYRGQENDFLADYWEVPLVIFFIFTFALGWWAEGFFEKTVMKVGRQKALFAFVTLLLLFGLIELVSVILSTGFTRYVLGACGNILLSGFSYRSSVMRQEVTMKFESRE